MSTPTSLSPPSEAYMVTLIKNVKYVVIGGMAARSSGVVDVMQKAFENTYFSTLGGRAIQTSLLLSSITVALFLYLVVFMPYVKGVVPNYSQWQRSPPLTGIVPALTVTILGGFVTLVYGLKTISSAASGGGSGLVGAVGGALGGYAAVFGLIGLIPTPKPVRPTRTD